MYILMSVLCVCGCEYAHFNREREHNFHFTIYFRLVHSQPIKKNKRRMEQNEKAEN